MNPAANNNGEDTKLKQISLFLTASLAFAIVMTLSAIGQSTNSAASAGPSLKNKHVKSGTAIFEIFGDGQKITAAAEVKRSAVGFICSQWLIPGSLGRT
jgi:uncharacterized protein (DUF2147 family)